MIPAVFITRVCTSISLLLLEAALSCRFQGDVAQKQPALLSGTVIFLQLVQTITEAGQSLQGAEVITFTLNIWKRCGLWAGKRDMGGRRRCRK